MASDDDYDTHKGATVIKTPVLQYPHDWDDWIFHVKEASIGDRIWKYIDPDIEPQPAEPIEPVRPTLPLRLPTDPPHSAEVLDSYRAEKDLFDSEMKEYRLWERAMNRMRTKITETTNAQYHTFFDEPGTQSLWARLRALRDNIQPSDRGRELQVETAYEKARRPNRRMAVNAWLNEFRKAHNNAQKMKLPIVDKDRPLMHFLQAIRIWDPVWSSMKETLLIDADGVNMPTVPQLIDSFVRRRGVVAGELALAKVVGSHDSTALPSKTTASFATFNKREDSWRRECLCHEMHAWKDCPYINQKVREPEWKPDPSVMAEINEKRKNKKLESILQKVLKRDNEDQARNNNNPDKHARTDRPKASARANHSTTKEVADNLAFAVARAYSATSEEDLKIQ